MTLATKINKSNYERGWSRIWGKSQGTLLLLPSEATHTIVATNPFTISCVLPATERQVVADFHKNGDGHLVDIETPQLLVQQTVYLSRPSCGDYSPCPCPRCYRAPHPEICYCHQCLPFHKEEGISLRSRFKIYTADFTEKYIRGAAYRIGNVYTHAQMCFGLQSIPRNLRQANAQFWGTPINNDFGDYIIDHKNCENKRHTYPRHHFEGIGKCSTVRRYCRRQVMHTCVCAKEHLEGCSCYAGCYCKCSCPCCSGTCNCACQCDCCKNQCYCKCKCDLNINFAQLLRNYRSRNMDITNITQKVVGKPREGELKANFLSTTQRTDAIFISFNDDLVRNYPTHVLRHLPGREPLRGVVGFAKRVNGTWHIDLDSDNSLKLYGREVYIP